MVNQFHIGTSGWHYAHWRGPFYPDDIPSDKMLEFYCGQLATVEINNSFYHLPSEETFRLWRTTAPPGFRFSVKASRYITHMKKLKDPEQSLSLFLSRAVQLESKLGPVLFQLPPRWKRDAARLKDFLQALPKRLCYAFEFRDPSWFHTETYTLFEEYKAAFCVFSVGWRRITAAIGRGLCLRPPSRSRNLKVHRALH
jgi:uncharacterized protein YecE (DUF72 family)